MSVLAGRRRIILFALFVIAIICPTALYWYEIRDTITTAARPLLVIPEGPRHVIPHFYTEDSWVSDEVCELHGWSARSAADTVGREVWDAIILNGPTEAELDLLELRLNELKDIVDKIFIVESNRTINGTPKGFHFRDRRWDDNLASFESKVVYRAISAPHLDSIRSPSPEAWSARLRSEMNAMLRTRSSNTLRPPVVLFSGVDEIPAAHTLRLLRDCAFPSPLHLQLRRFMYAFSWPVGWDSWRAQVHAWDTGTQLEVLGPGEARITQRRTEYSHEMVSEMVLADAGWHCTYCYRGVADLVAKMQDDYGALVAPLAPEQLQDAICEGKDLINTLPEAYSYKGMLKHLDPESSAIDIPRYTIEASKRFRHLLPGGCKRKEMKSVGAKPDTDLPELP